MFDGQEPQFTMPEGLDALMASLKAEWPTRRAALRASGVPVCEGDDENDDDKPDADADNDDEDAAEDTEAAQTFGLDYVKKLRAEAAKHRREAAEAKARAKQYEDADKSEAQKLEERATLAETRAGTAEGDLARLRVALDKGLTASQAKRLIGTTKEELEADADELLESFKTDDGDGQDSSRRPRERLRPGARPSSEPEETDPAKLAAAVPRMY